MTQTIRKTTFSLAVILSVSNPASAQTQKCTPTGDYCTPFIGCIAETGEIFRGQTRGRREGPLIAKSSKGATCKGTWKRTIQQGVGVTFFECNDGRDGVAVYTYFEKSTGTAVGDAKFGDGEVGQFWSGWKIRDYFKQLSPKEQDALVCRPRKLAL